jgi:hypothetical protein
MTKDPKEVEKYAPTLVFSKGENYFPCDVFFSGKKVVDNKQEYDKLNEQEKLGKISCYYHVNIGRDFTVYQYWYYYAHNPYSIKYFLISNNHEHDFECFKVFVGNKSKKPEYITCNRHKDRQLVKLDEGVMPEIKVELGGHGLHADTEPLPWYWKGKSDYDKMLKVSPLKSCEDLRLKVLQEPFETMDKSFKLIGSDYSAVGKSSAPTLPWTRWEYYLPEETLIGIQKMKLPVRTLTIDQSSDTFLEAIELGRKKGTISPDQYATLRSSFPALRAENEIEPPPFNMFFRSGIYTDILNQVGINSIKNVTTLDSRTIHLLMKKYIKENELKIVIPSTKDIEVWHKELVGLFG